MTSFISYATGHNFADENTRVCAGKTIQGLIASLESECEIALNWFNENKMIRTPGKFQVIIADKRKQNYTNEIYKIGSKEMKVAFQEKPLEAEVDNKLNFEQNIYRICKSPATQLGGIIKL